MATTLTALLNLSFSATVQDDTGNHTIQPSNVQVNLSNGTTADKADISYGKRSTIAASGSPVALDLRGGGLLGANGDVVSFVEVCTILIINQSSTVTVTAGGGSNAPAWLPAVDMLPGAIRLIHAQVDPAFPVTAGTGDIINLSIPSGTNVPVDVYVVGRSA
jgi:hypothetical protein